MNKPMNGIALASVAAAIVLAACGKGESPTSPPTPSTSSGSSATTPPPSSSSSTSPAPGGGEDTYNKTCMACHGTGAAGAPKIGDKADWGPRVAQGKPTLYDHAIKGFTGQKGAMPPKGGAAQLSDDDVKAAVDYMVSKAS